MTCLRELIVTLEEFEAEVQGKVTLPPVPSPLTLVHGSAMTPSQYLIVNHVCTAGELLSLKRQCPDVFLTVIEMTKDEMRHKGYVVLAYSSATHGSI
jgi:hypothetical protein